MRKQRLDVQTYEENPLLNWRKHSSLWSTVRNLFLIKLAAVMPLKIKNSFYSALGVIIGDNTAIGLDVTLDIFRPELIEIGSNTTIGFDSVILTHETTQNEFRTGNVEIGDNVLIGARTVILPGVKIGDGATVAANSVVTSDVEEESFVAGSPARPVED